MECDMATDASIAVIGKIFNILSRRSPIILVTIKSPYIHNDGIVFLNMLILLISDLQPFTINGIPPMEAIGIILNITAICLQNVILKLFLPPPNLTTIGFFSIPIVSCSMGLSYE